MILRRSRLGFDAKDGGRETRARWRGTYIFFSFRYGAAERSTPPIDDFFPSPSVYVVAEPTLLLKALETPMTQKKIKNKVPLAREGRSFRFSVRAQTSLRGLGCGCKGQGPGRNLGNGIGELQEFG